LNCRTFVRRAEDKEDIDSPYADSIDLARLIYNIFWQVLGAI